MHFIIPIAMTISHLQSSASKMEYIMNIRVRVIVETVPESGWFTFSFSLFNII